MRLSILLLLTFIGFILSLAWYLSNRGSKYWQENWERHVDVLEDDIIGSLYKTTLSYEDKDVCNPIKAYPFSVSKINLLISLISTSIWSSLVIISFYEIDFCKTKSHMLSILKDFDNLIIAMALLGFGVIILGVITWIFVEVTKGTSQDKDTRKINFKTVKNI